MLEFVHQGTLGPTHRKVRSVLLHVIDVRLVVEPWCGLGLELDLVDPRAAVALSQMEFLARR